MTVAGRPVQLLVEKASAFSLTCGPQQPRLTVAVDYEPKTNEGLGTIGLVREIETK
jgi:hypothetical protein